MSLFIPPFNLLEKGSGNMTRRNIQWIALGICILALILKIFSIERDYNPNYDPYILPIGFGIGIVLLAISLFVKKSNNYN